MAAEHRGQLEVDGGAEDGDVGADVAAGQTLEV